MQESTLEAASNRSAVESSQAAVETEAKPLPSSPSKPKAPKPTKRTSASSSRNAIKPVPRDRLTVPLGAIMAGGADAIGEPSRAPLTPAEAIDLLASASGVHGVTLTDDDLSPHAITGVQLTKLRSDFKRALTKNKLKVAAMTCDLAREGVFRDGALTSGDAEVRAYAVQKAMRAMDLGAEFSAKLMIFDLTREGRDVMGACDPIVARTRLHQTINFLCVYSKQKKYGYTFALRTQKPGLQRDRLWPTSAHHLVHIPALEHEEMVGVSVSFAAERAAGISPAIAIAHAVDAHRLVHVELGAGIADGASRDIFETIRTLEESGYDGFIHLDTGPMRAADADGVTATITNTMRRYLMLRAKARQWKGDAKIRSIKRSLNKTAKAYDPIERGFTVAGADTLLMRTFDTTKMRTQRLPYDQLDQRCTDILLG